MTRRKSQSVMTPMENHQYKMTYAGSSENYFSRKLFRKPDLDMPLGIVRTYHDSNGGQRRLVFQPLNHGPGRKLKRIERLPFAANSDGSNMKIITDDIDRQIAELKKERERKQKAKEMEELAENPEPSAPPKRRYVGNFRTQG